MTTAHLTWYTFILDSELRHVSWRQRGDGEELLLFTKDGVVPVLGMDNPKLQAGISYGQPLGLTLRARSRQEARPANDDQPAPELLKEPWTKATSVVGDGHKNIYFSTERLVWRLNLDNTVDLLAGQGVLENNDPAEAQRDGPGQSAIFQSIEHLAVGSGGALYVVDMGTVRVVQLPQVASNSATAPSVTSLQHINMQRICAVACNRNLGLLYLADWDTVHKVAEPVGPAVQLTPAFAKSSAAACEGFGGICGMAVTDRDNVILCHMTSEDMAEEHQLVQALVRTYTVDGAEVRSQFVCSHFVPEVLPQGGLILHNRGRGHKDFVFVPCDARPYRAPGTVRPEPLDGRARLGSDLAAFRSNPSAAPADITVRVGGRAFPAHRLVLSSPCEYFARLFAGGFSDSGDPETDLPDADPDAFDALLSYMYGGELRPTPALLRPLAELADRLVLPEASAHLQQQLLAATSPATVVGDMLWAERHGLKQLLEGLKGYYLRVCRRVVEAAPESLRELQARSPGLHSELYVATVRLLRYDRE